ncbi:hypothetical protein Tco_0832602 [Tanacetum coccineum]
MGTYATISAETKKWIDAEGEVVQIILTRIDNDIYSIVDACPNATEMWKAIKRQEVMETYATKWIDDEAEAVHIILIGIDNDIYSTVDACPSAMELWKAIKRLKHGESINVQDLETNLSSKFRKFTSQEGESLNSYYSRNMHVDNTPRFDRRTGYDRHTGHYDNQRAVNVARARENVAYHKEKMLLCKQEEAGIQLSAEQDD